MKVQIGNLMTKVLQATDEELSRLRQLLTLHYHVFRRRRGQLHPERVDKQMTFLYRQGEDLLFPSGSLPTLYQGLKVCGIDVEVVDVRVKPEAQPGRWRLRLKDRKDADFSHQDDVVKDALKRQRGIINIPTGMGKTIIMAKIIQQLGVRSLVMVPSKQLLRQTSDSFKGLFGNDQIGIIGDGIRESQKPIIVATQQSLYSWNLRDPQVFSIFVSGIDAIFIDECHHVDIAPAKFKKDENGRWVKKEDRETNTWYQIAMAIPAFYRFGMSATVEEGMGRFALESATGRVVHKLSVSDGVNRNVLCPADVTMIKIPAVRCEVWRNTKMYNRIVPGAFETNIINGALRNEIIVREANRLYQEGRKVLILVDLVENHGKVLADRIPNAIFLHGGHDWKEREQGLKDFKGGGYILIGTIFKEGFDCPEIDALILANGGVRSRKIIQAVGRVLRSTPGKSNATVIDFYDDDGDGMCDRHSQARLNIYRNESRYTVQVKGENRTHVTT